MLKRMREIAERKIFIDSVHKFKSRYVENRERKLSLRWNDYDGAVH